MGLHNILIAIIIPFFGTVLGAAAVFLIKNKINNFTEKLLFGFASGVMTAASIWSLILPSIDTAEESGIISWLPASVGFLFGMLFLLILDSYVPHIHIKSGVNEGIKTKFKKTTMMFFAITLHNIPEGMAVGIALAATNKNTAISLSAAVALSIGIAVQNIPEGAIISMPLKSDGFSKIKAFLYGVLSGAVEPIFAFAALLFSGFIIVSLPYLLAFAAGAMIYVVIEELIPESQAGRHSNAAAVGFAIGFASMMIFDIAFG